MKSPPTTIKVFLFFTATELAPVVCVPCKIGMSTFLFLINKFDRNPPVTKYTSSFPRLLMLVPLLAKQASPLSATGQFCFGISCHVFPPSKVLAIKNLLFTGSPKTIPLFSFRKSMASKNIPFVLFS